MKRILELATCLLAGGVTLTAATLTGFTPILGEPGLTVTISGSGLDTATEVRFNNTPADFWPTGGGLRAIVPIEGTTGPLRVKLSPSTTLTSSTDFMVSPRVTEFSPQRGATNTSLLIYGANLLSVTNVQIAGLTASFHANSAIQLTATVPEEATNGWVGPIRVSSPAGSAISTNEFLVMGREPFVDGFSQEAAAPGAVMQVWGANLVGATAVSFSNLAARFTVSSASQINVTVPTNPVPTTPLTNLIRVVSAGGTGTCSQPFRITRAPVITNTIPEFGAPGRSVTLEGINFADVTGVGFNGVRAAIDSSSADRITVTIPANATSGPVTATNLFGLGARSFVVTRAPILDNYFEPPEGLPGRRVAIWGANLLNTRAVLFNGRNAAWFAPSSDIQVNADVPIGATSGPITVTNDFGSATTTNEFYVPGSLPYVTALTPPGGPRGTAVLINGGNFSSGLTVQFNGVTAIGAVATSRSQINAMVPAGALTGPVTITTTAGTSTNTQVFYASPRLAAIAPTNGIAGDAVVLTGTNFTGALAVSFAGRDASFTVNDTNRITAIVPPDATTGPLKLLTPGGAIQSTSFFRAYPHITDFAPRWGPPGIVVSVFGSSLQEASEVDFGGAPGSLANATATELQATVPAAASSGPIQVTTPDGVAVSSNWFSVTGTTDLGLRSYPWPGLVLPGATVTYTVHGVNYGPRAASQVRLTEYLPTGMVFESATSDRGVCAFTNAVVTCDFDVLEPLEEVMVTVVGVFPNEGVFVNTVTFDAFEEDPYPPNNTVWMTTTVVAEASRILDIKALPGGSRVRIAWPTSAVPFMLQAVRGLSSTNAWLGVTNEPSVVDGLNQVTNAATGESQFYRLRGP